MKLSPRARKTAFLLHVVSSLGWIGAVLAYLALAVVGLRGDDDSTARAAFLSMELIGFRVIIPLSFATFATGIFQSLATEWGLFRHYWIVAKLVIALGATAVLLVHMNTAVAHAADVARAMSSPVATLGAVRVQLVVHAVGGIVVLLAATVLSVFKPWGKTRFAAQTDS